MGFITLGCFNFFNENFAEYYQSIVFLCLSFPHSGAYENKSTCSQYINYKPKGLFFHVKAFGIKI